MNPLVLKDDASIDLTKPIKMISVIHLTTTRVIFDGTADRMLLFNYAESDKLVCSCLMTNRSRNNVSSEKK